MSERGKLAWGLVLLVGILHYDFWLWDADGVVLGFLPVGLAYQAGISIAAAIAWALVVRFAWPDAVEEWASGDDGKGSGPS